TDFKDWDARWPAMSREGKIAFTLGADLQVFHTADESVRKVDVQIPSDRPLTRSRYPDAAQSLTSFTLSPKGDRLALVTRGEVFPVPVKNGPTMPVTHGSGARERGASFSPDGKRIVYITDASGEEEIRTLDAWGRGDPKVAMAAGKSGYHYFPHWSPDGKWIAYGDEKQSLYIVPAGGGAPIKVDHSDQAAITDYAWSPDGRWLAYSKAARTDYSSLWIYDTKLSKLHTLTEGTTNDFGPAWDPDGRYLYFLSTRATNPILAGNDANVIETKNTVPFLVTLRKDVENPFAANKGMPELEPKSGAPSQNAKKTDKKDEDKDKGDKTAKPVDIDFDGLAE